MRKLTIIRKKSFVASAGKMWVYMQSKETDSIEIKGINYKLVGKIKNGHTFETEMPDENTVILLTWWKMESSPLSPKVLIKSEWGDYTLYAKTKLNPLKGNPIVIYEGNK